MWKYFALSKIKGVLEAVNIEISQILIKNNLLPNFSRLKCDKVLKSW